MSMSMYSEIQQFGKKRTMIGEDLLLGSGIAPTLRHFPHFKQRNKSMNGSTYQANFASKRVSAKLATAAYDKPLLLNTDLPTEATVEEHVSLPKIVRQS